jgi:hypothetical protein
MITVCVVLFSPLTGNCGCACEGQKEKKNFNSGPEIGCDIKRTSVSRPQINHLKAQPREILDFQGKRLAKALKPPFATMAALAEIDVPSLEKIASGKVRELFALPARPDALLFVASDRVSAFDAVLKNGIPSKGAILTLISAHWFQVLAERIPGLRTHFITLDVPPGVTPAEAAILKNRSMQVRKLEILKIEAIVYVAGPLPCK